jgi:hypothetical protein
VAVFGGGGGKSDSYKDKTNQIQPFISMIRLVLGTHFPSLSSRAWLRILGKMHGTLLKLCNGVLRCYCLSNSRTAGDSQNMSRPTG